MRLAPLGIMALLIRTRGSRTCPCWFDHCSALFAAVFATTLFPGIVIRRVFSFCGYWAIPALWFWRVLA